MEEGSEDKVTIRQGSSHGAYPALDASERIPSGFVLSDVRIDPRLKVQGYLAPELGNTSYVVSVPSHKVAAVIDPFRDAEAYLERLTKLESPKVLAIETHVHNDFVSGSRELAALVRAEIIAGQSAPLQFDHRAVRDHETLSLGDWELTVLETPGHTPEHVSYVLRSPEGKPRALFSGGALNSGGAARTDLLGIGKARHLARAAYRSIHEKLAGLPDDVWLLPTHGGSSYCGRVFVGPDQCTMAEARQSNRLLQLQDEEAFLAEMLCQHPYPKYFHRMREINSSGCPLHGGMAPAPVALSIAQFQQLNAAGAIIVDTREARAFDHAHIPGSLSIPADGPFSSWYGWLVDPQQPTVLVSTDAAEARNATRQLFRIGFESSGYLNGGVEAWLSEGHTVAAYPAITETELMVRLQGDAPGVVLDVREAPEWFDAHIPGSLNIPVSEIPHRASEIPREGPVYVYSSRSYRASVAASLLERAGIGSLVCRVYEGW